MIPFVLKALNVSEENARLFDALPCSMPVGFNSNTIDHLMKRPFYFTHKKNGTRVFVVSDEDGNMCVVDRHWKKKPFSPTKANATLPPQTILDAEVMPNGTIWVFDLIAWDKEVFARKSFSDRLLALKHLEDDHLLISPLQIKPWKSTVSRDDLDIPEDCDGLVFAYADAMLRIGRDPNIIKWKAKPTLDFYMDSEGKPLYRVNTTTLAPFVYYKNPLLDERDIDIVLPRSECRDIVVEFDVRLDGNKIVFEELFVRADKKDANQLQTLDSTFAEILSGPPPLFRLISC